MKQINRRIFIENLLFLAGGSAVAGSVPWMNLISPENKATDKVRLGFIGVGSRGRLLLLLAQQIKGVEIVAVCDNYQPNYDKAIQLTHTTATAYKDYRKLLEDKSIDGVVIATPLHEHARITIDAFSAGKAVFCEKAMAMTFEDCHNMILAHRNANKVFQVGHQRLFDHRYIKAMKDIQENKLGTIGQIRAFWHRNGDWRRPVPEPGLERKINWRLYNEYSLGLTSELGSHHFQVANWVYNEIPREVIGSGSLVYWKDGREVYDNIQLIFRYPSGRHLVYDSMISNKKYGLEVQVLGDLGTMELETNRVYSETPPTPPGIRQWIHNAEKNVFGTLPIGGASWIPETAVKYEGNLILDKKPGDIPNETQLSLEAFAEAIRRNQIYDKIVSEGYYGSIMTVMAHRAMAENRIVALPKEYMI